MMGSSAFRRISHVFARLAVRHRGGGQPTNGRQDKSAAFGPAHVVGRTGVSALFRTHPAGASAQKKHLFNAAGAISCLVIDWRHS